MNGTDFIKKLNSRVIFPKGEAVKLSDKLRELAQPKHVSQRWMAAEISKLVPEAVRLEQAPTQWAAAGFFAALLLMLILHLLVGGSS